MLINNIGEVYWAIKVNVLNENIHVIDYIDKNKEPLLNDNYAVNNVSHISKFKYIVLNKH